MKFGIKKRVYLDFASATPLLDSVIKEMRKAMPFFANPASLYEEGRSVKKILDNARKSVATHLRAHTDEIVFTSGGTESNNLALFGTLDAALKQGALRPHIIVSSIEHSSILEMVHRLEARGAEVSFVKPDEEGLIDPRSVQGLLKENTIIVSIMYANNEIGTVQPISEIAKAIRAFKKNSSSATNLSYPLLHTDAAQAANYLSLDVLKLGVDLMTIDSGKIYGPKGMGLLFIKRGTLIEAQMIGGGQEDNFRSGTEHVVSIVGFAKALDEVCKIKEKESLRLVALRDYFVKELLKNEGVSINGSMTERLPNNVSACFPLLDAEFALYQLDARGIACSSASTCMNLKEDSYSYVVRELGKETDCSTSSLRFSFGRTTTKKDIDFCLKALKEILLKQRFNLK